MNGDPAISGPILVAIDLCEQSAQTLGWAAGIARCGQTGLMVLLVAHDPDDHPGMFVSDTGEVEAMTSVAERRLHEFLGAHSEMLEGIEVTTEVVSGLPASRTVEVADQIDAGHIVIGSHGRSGWVDRVVGSEADRIIRHARVPVTVVKVPPAST
jgi:nucleotide-binding universal stress UspA family protein